MTLQEIFNRIRDRFGFITIADVEEIRKLMPSPRLQVLVRCGCDRFLCGLDELDFRLAEVDRKGDYVRDVSIPANPKPVDWISLGYRQP